MKYYRLQIDYDDYRDNPWDEWDGQPEVISFSEKHSFTNKKERYSDEGTVWNKKERCWDNYVSGSEYYTDFAKKNFKKSDVVYTYRYNNWGSSGCQLDITYYNWGEIVDDDIHGFIYLTKKFINKEYGWGIKTMTKKNRERAKKDIERCVKTFQQYLDGDVYWYKLVSGSMDEYDEFIEDDDPEEESCGGFFGDHEDSGIFDCLDKEQLVALKEQHGEIWGTGVWDFGIKGKAEILEDII